jgi:ABC-type antimicrobial peptide transport system permease subunit
MKAMRVIRQDIYENLKMGLATLRSHKLRSFLTVLGVVIGVWVVMAIASIISGIDVALKKEVESFGVNSIFISKIKTGINTGRLTREMRLRKDLTYEDAEAIAQLPAVELSVPFLNISNDFYGRKILVSGNGKTSAAIRLEGTLPDYLASGQEVLTDGRFFTQYENDTSRKVCIIRGGAAASFFPEQSPVGETLKIDGEEYLIVGALAKREQIFGGGTGVHDLNNGIFLPFNTARKLKPNATEVFILAVAKPGMLAEAQNQVDDLLRTRRRVPYGQESDFGMSTSESIVEEFRALTFGIAMGMIVISSMGLLVGGIGVMNIMLVSVTERTREIGIRKALGARRREILYQFLIEAITLTGAGGLIGLLLGWATTLVIRMFVPSYVPVWAPVAGLAASVGIGIFFGLWPALKAARLNPVDSLRYE